MKTEIHAEDSVIPGNHPQRNLTRDDLDRMAAKVSNWGRWGKDDEIGTLNHVTPARIQAAARLIRQAK